MLSIFKSGTDDFADLEIIRSDRVLAMPIAGSHMHMEAALGICRSRAAESLSRRVKIEPGRQCFAAEQSSRVAQGIVAVGIDKAA